MAHFLGIDVGTTHIKAIAFDEDGRARASSVDATPTIQQGRGLAVHDAEQLWETVTQLIRTVVEEMEGRGELGHADIAGVAVASMAEEGFPLDGSGQPLYPGILWHDERTQGLAGWWEERAGWDHIYALTGLPPDHIYTALKMQWLQRHEPEVWQRAAHWLWVGDYITFRLSGAMVTTPSLASRSMLYDLLRGSWSEELLELAEIPSRLLPSIADSGTVAGSVSPEAAGQTNLAAGTPVITGGHDHICGCLASGVVEPGDMIHSGGTAESVVRTLDRTALQELLTKGSGFACGAHVVPGRYYVSGFRYSGAVLGWWERLLAGQPFGPADRQVESSPPGAHGLVFVPYMFGKGSPEADQPATGSLLGLTADHGAVDILRAVVEGICYDLVDLHEALCHVYGDHTPFVTAIGGLAHIRPWLEVKSSLLEVPVRIPEETEAVAQGAALLAGLGVGLYRDVADTVARTLRYREVVEPQPEMVERYRELYRRRYLPAVRAARGLRLREAPGVETREDQWEGARE